MTPYQRIFGSGPLLLMLALVLVIGTVRWQGAMIGPRLQWNFAVRLALAGVVFVVGIAIVVWSFQTLTLRRRGRELVTTGPYHYVRHPLYSVMFWGPHLLVFFLTGTWLALLALVLMFVAGHLLIGREEKLMELEFGEAWREYARRTPRFLPRLVVR